MQARGKKIIILPVFCFIIFFLLFWGVIKAPFLETAKISAETSCGAYCTNNASSYSLCEKFITPSGGCGNETCYPCGGRGVEGGSYCATGCDAFGECGMGVRYGRCNNTCGATDPQHPDMVSCIDSCNAQQTLAAICAQEQTLCVAPGYKCSFGGCQEWAGGATCAGFTNCWGDESCSTGGTGKTCETSADCLSGSGEVCNLENHICEIPSGTSTCNQNRLCVPSGGGMTCDGSGGSCGVVEYRCNTTTETCEVGGDSTIPCNVLDDSNCKYRCDSSSQQCRQGLSSGGVCNSTGPGNFFIDYMRDCQPRCNSEEQCFIGGAGGSCTPFLDYVVGRNIGCAKRCANPTLGDDNVCGGGAGISINCTYNTDCQYMSSGCNQTTHKCYEGEICSYDGVGIAHIPITDDGGYIGDPDALCKPARCTTPQDATDHGVTAYQCMRGGSGEECDSDTDCPVPGHCTDNETCVTGAAGEGQISCDLNNNDGSQHNTTCEWHCPDPLNCSPATNCQDPNACAQGLTAFYYGTCNHSVGDSCQQPRRCNTSTFKCETGLAIGTVCTTDSQCVACTPNCTGKVCGDDGCGGTCSPGCDTGETCSNGQCVACTPNCTGKVCGDDGCGGTCSPGCSAGQTCSNGQCVACTPNCTGKVCGDDGCGGTCGTCGTGQTCSSGQCVCQPNCTGKVCGDDGCGGTCGTCGTGRTCLSGTCYYNTNNCTSLGVCQLSTAPSAYPCTNVGGSCCRYGTTKSCTNCGTVACQIDGTWPVCPPYHLECNTNQVCDCVMATGTNTCSTKGASCVTACTPGATQSCNDCGTQTCLLTGVWGLCVGGTATQACDGCKTQSCNANGIWGACSGGHKTCKPDSTCACTFIYGDTSNDTCSLNSQCATGNAPPSASNLRVSTSYCAEIIKSELGTTIRPQMATFMWDYSDAESDSQTMWQLQISTTGGSNFENNIIYDSKIRANTINNVQLSVTDEPTSLCKNEFHTDFNGCDHITYGENYYWRVKVWEIDSGNIERESNWTNYINTSTGSSIYTYIYAHHSPAPIFEVTSITSTTKMASFADSSKCYSASNMDGFDCKTLTSCSAGSSGKCYSWWFKNYDCADNISCGAATLGTPDKTAIVGGLGDTTWAYSEDGKYISGLKVCDDIGCCFSNPVPVRVGASNVPKWQETSPFK